MSDFRTWLWIMWCETWLKPQNVARRHLPFGDGIKAWHPAQQAGSFQLAKVLVQC
jgi:hypothetical protein